MASSAEGLANRDHPRVCGEHPEMRPPFLQTWGSSPRMRGAPSSPVSPSSWSEDHPRVCGEHAKSSLEAHARAGIIPAYAGSTSAPWRCRRCTRDHPRVCGEHASISRTMLSKAGSSPRMRGALSSCSLAPIPLGIIPAYAGSTPAQGGARSYSRDHPRVCGEHKCQLVDVCQGEGSSPRMRGAPRT